MSGPPGALGPDELRTLVERSPVATLMLGPDQRVRVANQATADLIGSPRSALVGLRPAELWDGLDGRRAQMALSGLMLGAFDSYRAEGRLRTSAGPLSVLVWVRRVQLSGGAVAIVIMVPDTELRLASRSVETLFGPDALDIAVGTLNREWRIDRITQSSAAVLGHEESELAGIDLASLIHPDDVDVVFDAVRTIADGSDGAVLRARLRHATRGWNETRCLLFSLTNHESSPIVFVLAESIGDDPRGPDAERIAALERHLLRFAAELHAGGWRDAQPLAVDVSRFPVLDELTQRQREIVSRLLRGERIPSIAASLNVSASTVRNHLSHVFAVFGVHSQSELLDLLRSDASAVQRDEPGHRD